MEHNNWSQWSKLIIFHPPQSTRSIFVLYLARSFSISNSMLLSLLTIPHSLSLVSETVLMFGFPLFNLLCCIRNVVPTWPDQHLGDTFPFWGIWCAKRLVWYSWFLLRRSHTSRLPCGGLRNYDREVLTNFHISSHTVWYWISSIEFVIGSDQSSYNRLFISEWSRRLLWLISMCGFNFLARAPTVLKSSLSISLL